LIRLLSPSTPRPHTPISAIVAAFKYCRLNAVYPVGIELSSDVINPYAGLSKVTRRMLQSAVLRLGAYLVAHQEPILGAVIASSITMARALAPIETAIANWCRFVAERNSIGRLAPVNDRAGTDSVKTILPEPRRPIGESLTVIPSEAKASVVTNFGFTVAAGEVVGIIGPSGFGEMSLLRELVAAWRPETFSPDVRYLSQAADLFDGTIAENIASVPVESSDGAVIRAAQAAGAHEMVMRLPNGYDTRVGQSGAILSAGQRQRVALAKALYGDPLLIVLDGPNADFDAEGELLSNVGDGGDQAAV
jgi:ABC-type protease/lipase transport system fused ATPase/permease subunit